MSEDSGSSPVCILVWSRQMNPVFCLFHSLDRNLHVDNYSNNDASDVTNTSKDQRFSAEVIIQRIENIFYVCMMQP